MTDSKRMMSLGAFFQPTGHHVTSWRHPQAQADAGTNFAHYAEICRTAERGKFDLIFLADNYAMREASPEALSRAAQFVCNFEPLTLLSAIAAVTERSVGVSLAHFAKLELPAREREIGRAVTLETLAGWGWERPFHGAAMWVFMLGFAGFPFTVTGPSKVTFIETC